MNEFRDVRRSTGRLLSIALVGLALAGLPAQAADPLKIGWVSTQTGPLAALSQQMTDGFMLRLDQAGGALGGMPTQIITGDDQMKPDVAVDLVRRMVKRDNVQIVAGILASNIMMAAYKPLVDANVIVVSANAAPSPLAGAMCQSNFFVASYQNDQMHGAMGEYVRKVGAKRVVLIAPDYQGGKDAITGFKRNYREPVAAEIYTKLNQEDFSAELARVESLKPDAVFIFMPGGLGITFIKQWSQTGLTAKYPLYSAFTVNSATLPALGDAASGLLSSTNWSPELDNPDNAKFIAAFKAKYKYEPSEFAAQGYDAASLIDQSIREVGGSLENHEKLLQAMHAARFASVRGKISFNTNNFPIQDFYINKVVKTADGKFEQKLIEKILPRDKDPYAPDCGLKW